MPTYYRHLLCHKSADSAGFMSNWNAYLSEDYLLEMQHRRSSQMNTATLVLFCAIEELLRKMEDERIHRQESIIKHLVLKFTMQNKVYFTSLYLVAKKVLFLLSPLESTKWSSATLRINGADWPNLLSGMIPFRKPENCSNVYLLKSFNVSSVSLA